MIEVDDHLEGQLCHDFSFLNQNNLMN